MQGITIVFDTITVRRDSGIAFDTWHQNYYVPSVLTAGQMLNVQCYGSPLRATHVSVFESNASPAELNGMPVMPAHDAIISSERQVAGFMNQHIALHYLHNLRALESKERDKARATPWRERLAGHAWFKGDYRVLYKFGTRQTRFTKHGQEI